MDHAWTHGFTRGVDSTLSHPILGSWGPGVLGSWGRLQVQELTIPGGAGTNRYVAAL